MFLTQLGIPKLWREDPEVIWPFLRVTAAPVVLWLAPSYSYGGERVPESGGGVIAVNHLSAIDPPLVGAHCRRTVFFMTKAEFLAMPIVGDLLSWTGAFSVRRGQGDRESLRQARAIAREGHLVGVFVEERGSGSAIQAAFFPVRPGLQGSRGRRRRRDPPSLAPRCGSRRSGLPA